jgi:hypothetical protein
LFVEAFEGSEERQTEVEECRSWHAAVAEMDPPLIDVSRAYMKGQSIKDVKNQKNNLIIEKSESHTRMSSLAN